uniref:Secreted protein n=1 Tax=Arundo donax TaxID=35708 RepID=A0A0A9EZZ0_ARUDO
MQRHPHLVILLSHPQHLLACCSWMPRVHCTSCPCCSPSFQSGKGCPSTTKENPNHSQQYLMLHVFKILQRKLHITEG